MPESTAVPAAPLPAGAASVTEVPGATFGGWVRREWAPNRLLRLAAITVQLVLLVATLRIFNLETTAFEKVSTLVLGSFLLHHFLPLRWRLMAFAAVSVASVLMIFGTHAGLVLLGTGALLVALCHVPLPMSGRIALVLVVAALLAAARAGAGWLPEPVVKFFPGAIWPILGSMFMFRLALYIYELKHRTSPVGAVRAAAYFFMVPNVCCPLFPVVDYRTFCRNHYNDDAIRIYQLGTKWILRGCVQLLLYRFLYTRCMIDVGDIQNGLDVGRYVLTTFLLYLKISGLFHLAIGILHLYGFNLPETHHLYLLSSSFTDFWRRINIYWKDFITKIVFYPLYFRWKKLGDARAVVLSTLAAFFATWLLHSYQWFWIRGTFPVVWSDLVFWLGLGAVVVLNVRWEQRRGRKRTLRKAARTLGSEVGLGLRTAGTFTAICLLWTIWSTPDLDEIRVLLEAIQHVTPSQVAILLAVPLAIGLGGVVLGRRTREHTEGTRSEAIRGAERFWPSALRVGAAAAAMLVLALRPWAVLPDQRLATLVSGLRDRGLNTADQRALNRGYYEELGDVTRFDSELWRLYGVAPKDWGREMPVMAEHPNAIFYSYLPSIRGIEKGAEFTTNADGLRDREYSKAKPPGSYRIAWVGSSHDAGSGVGTAETYENVCEDLFAASAPPGSPRIEIVNFSVNGWAPIQKLATAELRVPEYEPDLVVYAACSTELTWTFFRLEQLMERHLVGEYPFYAEALTAAGIDPNGAAKPQLWLERQLHAHESEALRKLVARFGASVRAQGKIPLVVLVDHPEDTSRPAVFDAMLEMCRGAGIEAIDLYGALDTVPDRGELWIAPWDSHTNPRGHRILALKLMQELVHRRLVPRQDEASLQ